MPVLTAAVVVLTVLVLLNLALTGAVIRRLRVDAAAAGGLRESASGVVPTPLDLPVGAVVPPFAAAGEDGEILTRDDLLGARTLVAFSSTTCAACVTQAPGLVAESELLAGQGIVVVPVLVGEDDTHDLAAKLRPAGPLVREPHGGPCSAAFGLRGTPSYALVGPDARVLAAGLVLADVVSAGATTTATR
ncbi:TlpA family protein disulfide reductase [Cellulosimicrobium terreum]|nr:TlpA family protein disulfide reductase [Cellulosimicrobium terreum]